MRISRIAVLLLVLLFCLGGPAFAGKNAGGALIVHVIPDGIIYTIGCQYWDPVWCTEHCTRYLKPESCEDARTRTDFVDPSGLIGTIIWMLAAFPDASNPGVSAVSFGIEHSLGYGYIQSAEYCGPEGTFDTPGNGWPNDWENAGNSIYFGEPIVGETLFFVYYFRVLGSEPGDFIGSGINPQLGYAAYASNDVPPVVDQISRFGQVRWFEPGFNDCPEPLVLGACCFEDGSCASLYEYECIDAGGFHWLAGTSCEPNPCFPAHAPEAGIEVAPWGRIKAGYR